jgi:4-hydroxybenzoate polyprenyltransferase
VPTWRAAAVLHPFPSALDAAVTGLIAAMVGGAPATIAQLAGAMLLLQFAIGAINDWADAPADAIARPRKPISAGLVGRGSAAVLGAASAAAGLLFSATAGSAVLAVAVAGLLTGLLYDLWLKGTAWAWLTFSAGFVLLPLFAWLGASGSVPPFMGWIVVLALPAGVAVSLANGLVDDESDALAGRRGPAVRLGRPGAHAALAAAHAAVIAGAATALLLTPGPAGATRAAAWAGIVVGAGLQAAGWRGSGSDARAARLRAWQVQAVGLALLAGSWFLGMTA